MGRKRMYKYSSKAKLRIASLEAKVKGLREVVTKRNALITNLNSKLYNIPLIFYLYTNLKDIHDELTKDLYLADYFILAYASLATSFTLYNASQIMLSVPQDQITPHSRSARSCLHRLVKKNYCQKAFIHGTDIYFITTNGRYHILQMAKRIRQVIVATLDAGGPTERSIFTEKKLRKIYGS